MKIKKNYINGEWEESVTGRTREIICTSNEEIMGLLQVPFGKPTSSKISNYAINPTFNEAPWGGYKMMVGDVN